MAELPLTPTQSDDAYSMTDIMGASHTVYDGSGLPMDDLPLEEPGEATPEPAAPSTPTPTPTPEPTPLRYSSQAEAERALAEATERERRFLEQQTALQQEMASLRQQVQDRATPQEAQSPGPKTRRYRSTFENIEGLDPSTEQYADARSDFYEEAVDAHIEDKVRQMLIQADIQAVIDARAQAQAHEALLQHDTQRQMLTERSSVVETAMRLGKERGYDIREPGDMTSNDSILFWAHAAQIPNEGPIEAQATQAFSRMPQRAPATTTPQPTTTRVQPMARSGATAPTTTPAEENGPFSLDAIMHEQRERQRIGRAA